jgi:hypothetical protein
MKMKICGPRETILEIPNMKFPFENWVSLESLIFKVGIIKGSNLVETFQNIMIFGSL